MIDAAPALANLNTAGQDARARLRQHVASATDIIIVAGYRALYASGAAWLDLGDAERLVSASLVDELARRHPALQTALDAWIDDLDTADTHEDVVNRFLDAEFPTA